MSDSYKSIIDSFDNLILELNKEFDPNPIIQQHAIGSYVISILLEPGPQKLYLLHKEREHKEMTIDEYLVEYCKNRVYNLKDLLKLFSNPKLKARWLSDPVKNWEFMKKIETFYEPTVRTLSSCHDENFYNYAKNGILNVFFRLTNYNNGSMIPIQDLVDLPTAVLMTEKMGYLEGDHRLKNQDFFSLYFWGIAIEGILFTLLNMDATFPAPYYPGLSVLEKKDTLAKALVDLELSFAKKPYSDSKLD